MILKSNKITFSDYQAYELFTNALDRVFSGGLDIQAYVEHNGMVVATFEVDLDQSLWTVT